MVCLGECGQLCRVEIDATFAHHAHWVQDLLSDPIFDFLDEIVIRFGGITVLFRDYVNDIIETFISLYEFLKTLTDDFPVIKVIQCQSHRHHFPLDGILKALGKIFPQCMSSELQEVQYEGFQRETLVVDGEGKSHTLVRITLLVPFVLF
ncbi:unnamed protein product [Somion occarium]|uniref:Uncharacterized protein n=1 Tax=Somion occarium TaxID=3059160 RepID=A0ABP1DIN1_9APHY